MRSHEIETGLSSIFSTNGRIYYILDEGPIGITDARFPAQWSLLCRDAFNGVLLWKRPMPNWGWRAWNAQRVNTPGSWLATRHHSSADVDRVMVADGDTLYVPLGFGSAISAIDGATGEVLMTYERTAGMVECIVLDGLLIARFEGPSPAITATRVKDGTMLWRREADMIVDRSLCAAGGRVFFHTRRALIAVDLKTGDELWRHETDLRPAALMAHEDAVLAVQSSLTRALSAQTGQELWKGRRAGIASPFLHPLTLPLRGWTRLLRQPKPPTLRLPRQRHNDSVEHVRGIGRRVEPSLVYCLRFQAPVPRRRALPDVQRQRSFCFRYHRLSPLQRTGRSGRRRSGPDSQVRPNAQSVSCCKTRSKPMILLKPHRADRGRLPRPVSLTRGASTNHVLWTACCALVMVLAVCAPPCEAAGEGKRNSPAVDAAGEPPIFTATADGGFAFDTGTLRGKLHAKDKMLGLTDVVHAPTGRSVAGRWGLMHLYRIFSGGRRFGDGARDWPTASRLLDNGAVEVRWPPAPDRPFELRALYRWHDVAALDVQVAVRAVDDLPTFEVFLSSYFDAELADPYIYVKQQAETGREPGFLLGDRALGHWLVSPRDAAAVALVRDGRWQAKPSPVDWAVLPPLAAPVALRRDRQTDLAAAMMAPKADCFAVFMPFAGEGHYSLYLSLFGHDVAAGEQAHARARLVVGAGLSDADVVGYYHQYEQQ